MQKARRHYINAAPTACKRTVSGSISLPYLGFFSPFPHGTSSLSVSQEYLALPDGPGRFRQGSTCPALLRILLQLLRLPIQGYHLYRSTFQMILLYLFTDIVVLQPRFCRNKTGLGYFHFARRYYGNHYCFLFLRLLRCFSSAGLRLSTTGLQPAGFPHSEMSGSKDICSSPNLIAAYHVFLRL